MSLNTTQLASSMVTAIRGVLKKQWPEVRDYAKAEAKKLAISMTQITSLYAAGRISKAEAGVLLEMQKNSARTVLLAIEGMGLIAVEMAINAALAVVKDTVNNAIGFGLLA